MDAPERPDERDESGHWLGGLSRPTHSVRALVEAQRALTVRQAARMGIGATDMRALRLLDLHGPLGASDLAHLLDLRPASVTSLIDRLEQAQLLERVRTGGDRRRVSVRARPQALERSFEIWAPVVRAMDALGHALDDAQQEALCTYLDAVTAAMDAARDG